MKKGSIMKALFQLDGTTIPDMLKGLSMTKRRHIYCIGVQQALMRAMIEAGIAAPAQLAEYIEEAVTDIAVNPDALEEALRAAVIMPYEEVTDIDQQGQGQQQSEERPSSGKQGPGPEQDPGSGIQPGD